MSHPARMFRRRPSFAGQRPVDDPEAWGYDRKEFWGTLRTAAGEEKVPSEQGRYHDYYEAFARAVHEGAPPPVTAEDGVRTLAVLDAARTSATEGRTVRLDGSSERNLTLCHWYRYDILDHAAEYDYGLPAFNITNMETMLGVMRAADATDSPVILQATRSARKFAGDIVLSHLVRAALETWPHLPICMHQDHGNNLETCQQAIGLGFSSVMMDGSLEEDGKTPASYDYNTRVTARGCECGPRGRRLGRGRDRLPRFARDRQRRPGRRSRFRGYPRQEQTRHRPGRGGFLRARN